MNGATQVEVTNTNTQWLIKDKFGGQEYKFPPGERVKVAAEVAEHIFGFGLDEKGRHQKFMRMGIANLPKGKEMWDRVKIRTIGNVTPTGVVREEMAGKAA
jgi:hypothetical protein